MNFKYLPHPDRAAVSVFEKIMSMKILVYMVEQHKKIAL